MHEENSVSMAFSLESIMSECLKGNSKEVNNDRNSAEASFNRENCSGNLPTTSEAEQTKQMHQEIIDGAVTVS